MSDIENTSAPKNEPFSGQPFKYIELFSGIGAFTQAIKRINPDSECVFAADINRDCANIFKLNYGIESLCDLTKKSEYEIPNHEFCFFSPPCQAFSKSGKQLGFEETRGTLIFEVFRILKAKKPKYILMENVRNLASHDSGNTIRVILESLHELGYRTTEKPLVLSPHQFCIPQFRERVFLPGIYAPEDSYKSLDIKFENLKQKEENSIFTIIDNDNKDESLKIRFEDKRTLAAWNEFYQGIDIKTIGFPVWADFFNSKMNISEFPAWKINFIQKNENLYKINKKFIDAWAEKWKVFSDFTPTQKKFEWQCGNKISSVYEGLIQFRPSGMRVKLPNVAPALVAIVQTSVIGKYQRKLSLKECLRLQDFPTDFNFGNQNIHESYKQLGNSICVKVLEEVTRKLLEF